MRPGYHGLCNFRCSSLWVPWPGEVRACNQRGRNEDTPRDTCLFISHTVETRNSNNLGISLGSLCWEKEKGSARGRACLRKETPHSSNTSQDEVEVHTVKVSGGRKGLGPGCLGAHILGPLFKLQS